MKIILVFLVILTGTATISSQQLKLISSLDESVKESSGLVYIDNKLITHNDSGGEPALYELDTITGIITRKVIVGNAANIDWEDICNDDKYIFIADFGNNNGNRTDLRIYRLPISDYLHAVNDTVYVDTISFNYKDQINFTSAAYATDFDAEAILSYNNSLYIFTKNWNNFKTNIYSLPKIPGTYQIERIDSIDSQGLITGATYDSLTNSIVLTGYTVGSAIIIEIKDFEGKRFSGGLIKRYQVETPKDYSYQIESITPICENQYFMTAEDGQSGNSALYKLETGKFAISEYIENKEVFIYPNPTTGTIKIQEENLSIVEIYNLKGDLLKLSKSNIMDISMLEKGIYTVIIKSNNPKRTVTKKLVVE